MLSVMIDALALRGMAFDTAYDNSLCMLRMSIPASFLVLNSLYDLRVYPTIQDASLSQRRQFKVWPPFSTEHPAP